MSAENGQVKPVAMCPDDDLMRHGSPEDDGPHILYEQSTMWGSVLSECFLGSGPTIVLNLSEISMCLQELLQVHNAVS